MAPVEAPVGAPYVQEEQPLGEIMQDRVTDLFRLQLAARERRQAILRTLQATARHQAELGKAAPITPPKAAPQVLVDRLQAEREKAAPTTPPKAAPKALGPSGSSTVEAPTPVLEAEEAEELRNCWRSWNSQVNLPLRVGRNGSIWMWNQGSQLHL